MSTSFVVNLGDLNKILEQIKIAERNAAGEALVDIIGQDAALLPLGLRTVDGSYNHLLPGQSRVGAADEIFPRLLTPEYRNEGDDTMMLAPPGSPGAPPGGLFITNNDYDPTIAGSHSVADADPRIISNLIVDQTLNNRSALVAALVVAGAENPNTAANDILNARAAMLADPAHNSGALDALISQYDLEISPDGSILIEHRSADIGLSPPNSAWMTFFGQFFDHGLDLVTKGGNGTIFIPLQADDPLIAGPDHILGNADDLPPQFQFMTLSRTTPIGPDGHVLPGGTEVTEHDNSLRRPEPDLHIQCLAPGFPARVQVHRGYER